MPEGFCTLCNFQIESFENLSECPNCGTINTPCSYTDQRKISINLHELRLLCIWAENWALAHGDVDENMIYAIAMRIRKQLNDENISLTMADEFRALKDAGYEYETNHPAGDLP